MSVNVRPLFLGLISLVAGMEIFLRFSEISALKLIGGSAMLGGVVIFGLFGWRGRQLLWKLASALLFVGYLAEASGRYPGLLKEAPPVSFWETASFAFKGFITLAILSSLVFGVKWCANEVLKITRANSSSSS